MPVRAEGLTGTAADPSPPPGLVVVGRFDQAAGYAVNRPSGSDSWLILWTTGGAGLVVQGRTELPVAAGDFVLLAPGVPQRYAVRPGAPAWRFWWAHCQVRPSWLPWIRPYDAGDGVHTTGPVPEVLRGRVESAFRRMLDDARWTGGEPVRPAEEVAVAHSAVARELALCALEEAVLLAAAPPSPVPPGADERIRRAQTLIAADPGAPHTVASLAEAVALSPSRFAHLFTEQLGMSPMRALREARLRHAARLLESTGLTAERVAAASGFASAFHFSRAFRGRYGVPPGEYRAGRR
ncbi:MULTISPECIES: helix-turn-helix domain-containing protein [unclassified Streptomyces]|uniref:helix-turn-helix domain-containing protein n=1 Tax=unclassified Streptomyces TaxID=2593676 RepID=UPI000DD866AB|nr:MULTISPECIES: helix-turn-helix domain-containing protein [unclassified Streptomyces]QZZ25978.1 helix-turn-helix domain-containing protein [Streptomyces sp. ST1015]